MYTHVHTYTYIHINKHTYIITFETRPLKDPDTPSDTNIAKASS
jgi:hypothetical protein